MRTSTTTNPNARFMTISFQDPGLRSTKYITLSSILEECSAENCWNRQRTRVHGLGPSFRIRLFRVFRILIFIEYQYDPSFSAWAFLYEAEICPHSSPASCPPSRRLQRPNPVRSGCAAL